LREESESEDEGENKNESKEGRKEGKKDTQLIPRRSVHVLESFCSSEFFPEMTPEVSIFLEDF